MKFLWNGRDHVSYVYIHKTGDKIDTNNYTIKEIYILFCFITKDGRILFILGPLKQI